MEISKLRNLNVYSTQIFASSQIARTDIEVNNLNISTSDARTSRPYILIGGKGLPIHKCTIVLKKFFSFGKKNKKSSKHPKRENFNAFIIRSIRKIFRIISKSNYPKSNTFGIDIRNPKQSRHWNELIVIYNSNPKLGKEISKTDNNPQKQKKNSKVFEVCADDYKELSIRQEPKSLKAIEKSFNQEYCKFFFENQMVEKAYVELIEIIFSEFYPGELCRRFNFHCCLKNSHDESCIEKWKNLRNYLENDYIKDLLI